MRVALARQLTGILRKRIALLEEMLGRLAGTGVQDELPDAETALLNALEKAARAGDDNTYYSRLAELRALQEGEARKMRAYFEAHRPLPPGAGYAAIAKARALLEGHESSSDGNRSSDGTD